MEEMTDALVWLPCDKAVWKKARILEKLSENQVKVQILSGLQDEEIEIIDSSKLGDKVLSFCNEFDEMGVDDMCNLNHLHEPAVLKNLELRFQHKNPYTYTGQICIAVNPYQWLGLYSTDLYEKYLQQSRSVLPPHPFALSSASYKDMLENGCEQSILVSGESGAGKTETVKIMMNHLASISGGGDHGNEIIDKVLKSNPVLESFGNAKTERNDNSSRFGKFAQLQFDSSGFLIGARCETYLLEKSRVVGQALGERNYHIFYQILSLPQDDRSMFFLNGCVEDYKFVRAGADTQIPDSQLFQQTKDAMDVIGIEDMEQRGIFEIVAGILNLGQIEFRQSFNNGDDLTTVTNMDALEAFAKLLHTDAMDMHNILCMRSMTAGTESYTIPLNCEQADNLRDAFAKGIYAHLFDWLIGRINTAVCTTKQVKHHVGLLDIFGFESFDQNSFEQLCINYANEKLQQKFNSDVFKTVQAEYVEDGIPLSLVTFADNQPILELIEGKMGIVNLLNEEVLRPMATDASFVSKVLDTHTSHSFLEGTKFNKMTFLIRHYAGDIIYDGSGFLEKNKDTLPTDLVTLLSSSASPLVSNIFTPRKTSHGARHRGYLVGNTIAGGFRKQLSELMENVGNTKVQYVRCIKPNSNKNANEFDRKLVADQLRYAGVIAAIRISREAFPNRMTLKEFENRFMPLYPSEMEDDDPTKRVSALLRELLPDDHEESTKKSKYAIGKSRVYFSSGVLQQLEDQRSMFLHSKAITIQKNVVGWIYRRRISRMKLAAVSIQAFFRCFVGRNRYIEIRNAAIQIQTQTRGIAARALYADLRSHRNSVVIEKSCTPTEAAATKVEKSERAAKVAAAEAAARDAQAAAADAAMLNKELQLENESLKSKLSSNVAEFADSELLRENERLKQQVASLQSQLMRAQEVSLVSAKVVDSRITYREGRQFVEYKLQIETNTRGTLFVWHRYSTFRNLAATLQSKNGYKRKEIPELPSKQLFGNFSEKVIQDRVERLNTFLDAATKAEYLQWGIRVDQDTCVYKRRVKSGNSVNRESRSGSSPKRSESRGRFSFRRSQAA